jgi:integral membrane protein (TIGR01906 family)
MPASLPKYATIAKWAVIVAIPIFLSFGTIRTLININFPALEYPRLAPDRYGWTPAQRLALAEGTLAFLQRWEPADEVAYLLEGLLDPNTAVPIYNEREIKHMLDVKNLTDAVQTGAWLATIVVIGGLGILLWQPTTRPLAYQALYIGGLTTVAILALIAMLIVVAWGFFFQTFHELLFPPGTWSFYYTDALIRLFPEQFWFDVGLILSLTPLFLGFLVAFLGWFLLRRQETQANHPPTRKPRRQRT